VRKSKNPNPPNPTDPPHNAPSGDSGEYAVYGNKFHNARIENAKVGIHFGRGVGPNDFYDTEFVNNETDIVSEGAVGQRFHGTRVSHNAPEPNRKIFGHSGPIKGNTCSQCGFEAFRWQRGCPNGHTLHEP
jgi:hypothetical protein